MSDNEEEEEEQEEETREERRKRSKAKEEPKMKIKVGIRENIIQKASEDLDLMVWPREKLKMKVQGEKFKKGE